VRTLFLVLTEFHLTSLGCIRPPTWERDVGGSVRLFLRRSIASIACAAVLCAVLPTAPAFADYRGRQSELQNLIEQKRRQIHEAEAKERDLVSRILASDARKADLQRQLDAILAQLADARAQLGALESRIDLLSVSLQKKTRELEQTLAALETQQKILDARVAEIYVNAPSQLSYSYDSLSGLGDLVAANEYQASVVRSDQRLVSDIQKTKESIQQQRADISERQQVLQVDRDAAAREAARIAAARAARAAAQYQVQREIDYKEGLLREVRSQKEAYKRALDSYIAESDTIAEFLRGKQRGQGVIQGQGGYLRWPVSGRITSGYGWRTHPIYGYRSLHTGIDIGSPSGTTVKAARYGTVLYTGYKGAYGLVVILDHGKSLATMYAHLSKVYVRPGDRVKTLGSVGAVGSTGWSTGPHLHFEVRVDGEPSNPIRWL